MTTTVVDKKKDMVSSESITYMRPIAIKFSATDCKPNCRMYATFDGIDVNYLVTPDYGPEASISGGAIYANSEGRVSGTFNVPGMMFNTGEKIFRLTENPNFLTQEDIPGSTYGYALATFTSTGIKETYQETVTSTTTSEKIVVETVYVNKAVTVPVYVKQPRAAREQGGQGRDPLAQSFFTDGYDGGCFITSIDLYFYSKDETYPVIVELREMVNGYPGPNKVSEFSRVSLDPANVFLSEDASVPTNFKFSRPIYLQEDKEYCFVIMANCQTYNVFTCTMGDVSLETGKKVFEQPMLGSLFKSQNNSTWTAEQYEDIKFKMYRAKFNTAVNSVLKYNASAPAVAIETSFLETFNGSNTIRVKLPYDHNLTVGSKVAIAMDSRGTYNGISASNMSGEFSVSSILDEQAFEFPCNGYATKSGDIQHGGFVSYVYVDNQGAGYSEVSPPTVTIDPPTTGTTATATAEVVGGKVVRINIVNPGSGYTSVPNVSFTGGSGTGATATASLDVKATIVTNRSYSIVTPAVPNYTPAGTAVEATMSFTNGNYPGGNIISYTEGDPIKFNLSDRNWLLKNAWLCSYHNEQAMMAGRKSATISMVLSSDNDNLSPMISKDEIQALFTGYHINNQTDEDINSTNTSGTVDRVDVLDGGTGYSSTPTISLVSQYGCPGTGATATAIMSSGTISSIVVGNPGSGYVKPPMVVISGASTTPASAQSVLTSFNTEVSPGNGLARSKYISKINTIEIPADSARVYVTAYSNHNSNFDVYVRTSLKASGLAHTGYAWKLMNCDVERNKSSYDEEYLEYEFYLDDLDKFDTYDIKIVIRSNNPIDVPWIKDFRAIMTI